jgi:aminoglycoside phosphotransferase (APT) family kinase protein
MNFSEEARKWLSQSTGILNFELDITRMNGANSSLIFLVQSAVSSASEKFVLRVLDNKGWLAEEPDLIVHEATALKEAAKAGLRAPKLINCSSQDIGFGGPALLMSYMEGKVELFPTDTGKWLQSLADELVSIHNHKAEGFGWNFSSWVNRELLTPPAWTQIPDVWEKAIDIWLNHVPDSSPVFLHRDYHPTNVLCQKGEVIGTVDWINACRGPAEVDIAHCRTNFVQMESIEVADEFLKRYLERSTGFEYNYYWDIDSIFDMNLPDPEFYKPWLEFGLDNIPIEVLRRRIDAYLAHTMRHF